MTTTIRAFIAIELPTEAEEAIAALQNRLQGVVPARTVRWTAPQTIHLTLHFLGDIAAEDVDKIRAKVLETVTATVPAFSLTIAGLGCFPNLRRPRIVWTGVEGDLAPLQQLQRRLGEKLAETIGFKPETRPYSPHLTLGRVKELPARQLAQLSQALEREQGIGQLITLPVTEICLIKSELTPAGPIYTQLCAGKLKS